MVLGLAAVLAGGLVVAGFATALQAGAAEQAAAPATAQSPAALPAGRTYTVTLLTGDAVTVHTRSSGCPIVSVKPADPKGVLNRSCGPDGHVRVVPGAVAALVGPVLDPSLFDVTTLIAEGFDDTHSEDLPLIVQVGTPTAKTAKTADPLAVGMSRKRTLSSVGAVSGRQPKARGGEFVRALMAGRAAQQSAPAARASTRVWLDRRVRASAVGALTGAALDGSSAVTLAKADKLDRNLKQIGAPAAWSAGFTGQGTKVAVLDTGADFTHPDLVGKVDEQADFTVDGGDAVDHFGHGTHVASTIAGTGAAANGARKGVAPGARLLIGKVLHDNGYGSSSDVIAGMEWAAPRAKVVNMSLGNSEPSDGSDPLSAAVDALSNQYGTLFVVAAGNAGSMDGQVGGPGAASTALTVGAVDGSDALAEFSSRGPLVNTRAAKPELVAPGVDIVAARAAGTTMGVPVDANYTTASGTSMATPHVAGAAAILAQRHPQWTAAQLKAVLTGAVDPLPGADPYAVGAGRLNIARALAGVSSARGVVNLGAFAYPQAGTADTTLAWSNATPGTVTLSLELKVTDRHGESAPAGAVTLSASSVPVAAGAGGDVVLRVDRAALAAGPGF